MSLFSWLEGVATVAFTLIPFFLIWACTALWLRFRSGWTLTALIGATSAVIGVVAVWVDFYIHYSSVETMMAQNADPNVALQLAMKLSLSIGFLVASLALVGHARSLPK
jgi:hypothetical protein